MVGYNAGGGGGILKKFPFGMRSPSAVVKFWKRKIFWKPLDKVEKFIIIKKQIYSQ